MALFAGLFVLLASQGAQAATTNWTWNGTTDTNLATAADWTNGTTPANSANAIWVFGSTNTQGSLTLNNNFTAGQTVGGITFNAGALAYIINGNSINLSGGITNNSTSLETFGTTFALQAAEIINSGTTGGSLLFNGAFSGGFGLTFNGTGTVTLSGSNNYTGTTTLNSGTLNITASGALGTNATTISSGTLNFGTSGTTNTAYKLNVNGVSGSLTTAYITNGAVLNLVGPDANTRLTVGSGNANSTNMVVIQSGGVFSNAVNVAILGSAPASGELNVISNNGGIFYETGMQIGPRSAGSGGTNLFVQGAGTSTIVGTLTFLPGGANQTNTDVFSEVLITNGSFSATTGISFGNGAAGFASTNIYNLISNGAGSANLGTVNFGNTQSNTVGMTNQIIMGDGTLGDGTTTVALFKNGFNTNAGYTNQIIWNGGVLKAQSSQGTNFLSNGVASVTISNAGGIFDEKGFNNTIGADITGSGGLTVTNSSGNGTLTLSGNNSFGGLTVAAGSVVQSSASALGSNTGSLNLAAGMLNVGIYNDTFNSVTFGNGTLAYSAGGGTLTATSSFQATNSANITLSNSLAGAAASFTQSGTGTTTLSGNNSFGGLTVAAGSVVQSSASALGSNTGSLNLAAGMLNVGIYNDTFNSVTFGNGTLAYSAGGGTLTATSSFQATNSANITLSNSLAGAAASFTQSGTGTTTLSGNNSFGGTSVTNTIASGGTVISGSTTSLGSGNNSLSNNGTLNLNGNNLTLDALNGSGAITNTSATALNFIVGTANGAGTYSGTIGNGGNGAITFTKNGTGIQTLSGNNSFLGGIALNNGTLQITNDATGNVLGGSNAVLTLGAGTQTLNLGGGTQKISSVTTVMGNNVGVLNFTNGTLAASSNSLLYFDGLAEGSNASITSGGGFTTIYLGYGSGSSVGVGAATASVLAGSNSPAYVVIQSGSLELDNNQALGNGVLYVSGSSTITTATGYTNGSGLSSVDLSSAPGNVTLSSSNSINFGSATLGLSAYTNTLAVATNSLLVFTNGVTNGTANAGVIGSLVKSGSGTLILGGLNQASSTAVNNGTLFAMTDGSLGTNGLSINGGVVDLNGIVHTNYNIGSVILGNGTITDGTLAKWNTLTASNGLISANLSGAGTVTKNGTGTVTLSGSNNYTGTTTLNSGTLNITASGALGTNATTISSGTLNFGTSGTTNTAYKLNVNGVSGSLTTAYITNGAVLNLVGPDANTRLTVGSGNANSTNMVVIQSGGVFSNAVNVAILGSAPASGELNVISNNGGIFYETGMQIGPRSAGSGGTNLFVQGAGTSTIVGTLTFLPGGANQTNTGVVNEVLITNGSFSATTGISFGNGAAGFASTNIYNLISNGAGSANLGTVNFGNTQSNTVGMTNQIIMGDGTLGDGTTTVALFKNGFNTNAGYTNQIIWNGGVLKAQSSQGTNFLSNGVASVTISNAGGIFDEKGFNNTIGADITGSGGLTVTNSSGNGTLTLSGANSFGGTGVSNVVASGATVISGSTTSLGSGNNSLSNNGTLNLNGNNLTLDALNGSGAITNTSATALNFIVGTANGAGTYSGTIGNGGNGAITFTKNGTGIQTLSGSNSYTGGTTLNSGTLVAGSTNAFGASGSALLLSGGNLDIHTDTSLNAYNVTVASNVSIEVDRATVGNGITNTLGTLNIGAGTLSVRPGVDFLNTNTAYGLTFGSATLTGNATFDIANNGSGVGNLTLGSISGANGFTKANNGQLSITGASSYTGPTVVNGGTLAVTGVGTMGATTNALTLADNTTLSLGASQTIGAVSFGNSSITGGNTLTGASYSATNSGAASIGSTLAGTGGFTQSGAGTTIFSVAQTYTGRTAINSSGTVALGSGGSLQSTNIYLGTLAQNGTLDVSAKTSGYTLTSSQTLSGSGTVTVASGQTLTVAGGLSPGDRASNIVGAINATGDVTLASSAVSTIQLYGTNAGSFDTVNITTGKLTYGGTLSLVVNTNLFIPAIGNTYQILNFASSSAGTTDFSQVALAGSWIGSFTNSGGTWAFLDSTNNLSWNFSEVNGQLTVAAIPEPEDLVIFGGIVCGAVLFYRRCKAHKEKGV